MTTGSCFCGAAAYEVRGNLCNARSCHCSNCRKIFSGACSAYAEISKTSEFRWTTGEHAISRYSSMPGWEVAFCRTCGTTLCGIVAGTVHGVALGTVDGDPGIEIQMHIFVGSKAAWDHIGGPAPQYQEGPPTA